MVISPPKKRSRMKFPKVYNKMYFCDILVIYVDIFSDYVKNRLHPEGLIWSVQTIREVHSRPMFWGLKWVPYSPSIVGEGVQICMAVGNFPTVVPPLFPRCTQPRPLMVQTPRISTRSFSKLWPERSWLLMGRRAIRWACCRKGQ